MKLIAFISVSILFNLCLVHCTPFNIGNLFRSHINQKSLVEPDLHNSDELKVRQSEPTEEDTSLYSSESYFDYASDSEELNNSSSDKEFSDLLSWNSSSDTNKTKDTVHNSTSKSVTEGTSTPAGHIVPERPQSSKESILQGGESSTSSSVAVTWSKVTTPAQSTTVGHSSAVNFTTEEQEEVVLVTGETTTHFGPKTIFQKSLDWVEDEYTLSILLPISAGVIFAITIICTIAMCRCVRRCCRRRRFRKKCLPDSVKHLSASDRARLLGDTSDEEF